MTINNEPKKFEYKTLKEALSKFQELNVKSLKDSINPHFKSKYADLTSVINAVNFGAKFGLSFTQSIRYENVVLNKKEELKNDKEQKQKTIETQEVHRDIFIDTIMQHNVDEKTLSSCVPVLITADNKDNPQKMGLAITYAKRYGLQALYGLASEDDDGNSASIKSVTNEVIYPKKVEVLNNGQPK